MMHRGANPESNTGPTPELFIRPPVTAVSPDAVTPWPKPEPAKSPFRWIFDKSHLVPVGDINSVSIARPSSPDATSLPPAPVEPIVPAAVEPSFIDAQMAQESVVTIVEEFPRPHSKLTYNQQEAVAATVGGGMGMVGGMVMFFVELSNANTTAGGYIGATAVTLVNARIGWHILTHTSWRG